MYLSQARTGPENLEVGQMNLGLRGIKSNLTLGDQRLSLVSGFYWRLWRVQSNIPMEIHDSWPKATSKTRVCLPR